MKAPTVIAKNLKLLFRSKESVFTIIFGPLIIILLVSAAYTGGDAKQTIRIGTVAEQYTPLADSMVTSLKQRGYLVSTFTNESDCIERIKTGTLNTCILFPQEFSVKANETSTVIFAVDYSRVNLVYQIIDGLSSEFNLRRTAITETMAGAMLQRVATAQREIHGRLEDAKALDTDLATIRSDLGEGRFALEHVDVNVSFTDLHQIRGSVTGLSTIIDDLRNEGDAAIQEAITTLQAVRSDASNDTRNAVDETIVRLENASERLRQVAADAPTMVQEAGNIIDDAAESLRKVRERFGQLVNASREVDNQLISATALLDNATTRLTLLRGTLSHVDASLQESLGTTATSIASPIATRIEPVSTEQSKLTFTYPYVLMLIVMFLGLMLSSSLIVMDKTSRAAFRNFTTATRDEYHVLLSFVTTFLILLVQVCIILLVSYFFIRAPLFSNFGVSLIIISVAITLFSFLGMIIGYLSGTQESAMISSLSIGSIFLFISNLVLPLEAMNRVVQALSIYNPYVVLSELLKQSMLFQLRLRYIPDKIGLLVAAILLLFLLILGVQRSFKARYFRQRSRDLTAKAFSARAVKPLTMNGRDVHDLFDLLAALDAMTRAEFEAVVTQAENPIAAWARGELKEKRLARRLDTRSKELMILALDKHLKKVTKRLAKQ